METFPLNEKTSSSFNGDHSYSSNEEDNEKAKEILEKVRKDIGKLTP